MPRVTSRPSDLAERWEVRTPLRHGSKHVAYYVDEQATRAAAERIEAKDWEGCGLQIHTKSRTIYINHPED